MLWWILAGASLAAVLWFLRLVIDSGASYKAKVLSTMIFSQHRDADPRRAPEVSDDSYRILRAFAATVDRPSLTVTASFAGLRKRTAVWRPGFGTTLAYSGWPLPPFPSRQRIGAASRWEQLGTPATLTRAIDDAFAEPDPKRLRRTQAVVVVRGGAIVAERYAAGFDVQSLFPGWSAAKSVAASLIGILVGEGRIRLADTELRPEWRHNDPRGQISVEDLLRMRSGLRFKEVYTTPLSDVMRMLYREPDMAAYAASLPLAAAPGTIWNYAGGTTNILSALIREKVGAAQYPDWPHRVLFDRIGIVSVVLEPDAAGTFVLSSYMLATARDWARYGQFHIQDGVWNGQRILPEGWMAFCRTPTPQSPDGKYGAHWVLKLNPDIGGGSAVAATLPSDTFFSIGHEGQTLTIIPSLDLVIVRHGLSIYIDAWNQAQFVRNIIDAL